MITLQTERLLLRPWKETDLAAFAVLNQDPKVMEYFPSILSNSPYALRVAFRLSQSHGDELSGKGQYWMKY